MSANDFIRPGADWSGDPTVDPSEMQKLDQRQQKCIHSGGGTWSIGSGITLGGAYTVRIESPVELPDLASFEADGVCLFRDGGGLTFYNSTLLTMGGTSTLSVAADANFFVVGDADMTIGTTHTVAWSSSVTFSAGTHTYAGNTVAGAQTRTGKTTFSGASARRVPRVAGAVNSNATYGTEIDSLLYQQTNGANHGLTLRVTESSLGAGDQPVLGEEIKVSFFRTPSTGGTLAVSCETGPPIVTFGTNGPTANDADNRGGAVFEFDGTRWRLGAAGYWGTGTSVAALDP